MDSNGRNLIIGSSSVVKGSQRGSRERAEVAVKEFALIEY